MLYISTWTLSISSVKQRWTYTFILALRSQGKFLTSIYLFSLRQSFDGILNFGKFKCDHMPRDIMNRIFTIVCITTPFRTS
jgi:hypothetical protein